jgi:murein tripeptide amidase MpaA
MSDQMTPEQAAQEKMNLLQKYAPELQQGLNQSDVDGLISRLTMDKALSERHLNTLADKLIMACQERDRLAGENKILKDSLLSITRERTSSRPEAVKETGENTP